MTPYIHGGGSVIQSPWGSNQSIECDEATAQTVENYLGRFDITFDDLINSDAIHSGRAQPIEFCVKDLTVNPGNQLSLQVHQGREEYWIVKSGLLTVIVDGQQIDVNENQAIFIPKGAIHCMKPTMRRWNAWERWSGTANAPACRPTARPMWPACSATRHGIDVQAPPSLASPGPPRGCSRSWGGPANDMSCRAKRGPAAQRDRLI